jgi:Cof subfamily protein (haloacid dehalogenase superfamily)
MKEIKLIATDMDGTLLNSKGELDASFYSIFEQLKAKGILFAAASGRQYFNLEKRLDRIKDDVFFVAENGSYVVYRGQELYLQALTPGVPGELLQTARQIPNAYIVYCGKQKAYVESKEPAFWEEFTKYFERFELVDDLLTITDDPCLKMTVCDLAGAATNSYPYFKAWENELQVKVSGKVWLDISHRLANKGQALSILQEKYGISVPETMVFGDYLNDLEMMQQAYYSYAVANAHADIKKAARFSAKSNDEHGVLEVLRQCLNAGPENRG